MKESVRQNVPQSRDELEGQLADQLLFLKTSCALYDASQLQEAKRLAVAIRVLLHESRASRSLLGQLDLKNIAFFDTTNDHNPNNLLAHYGLVSIRFKDGLADYVAMFDNSPRGSGKIASFEQWWNKIVFIDSGRAEFSRKDLVLAVANQDGGAHVDPELTETYASLSRNNSLNWSFTGPGETVPLGNPVPPSIRQMTHELIRALELRQPLNKG